MTLFLPREPFWAGFTTIEIQHEFRLKIFGKIKIKFARISLTIAQDEQESQKSNQDSKWANFIKRRFVSDCVFLYHPSIKHTLYIVIFYVICQDLM